MIRLSWGRLFSLVELIILFPPRHVTRLDVARGKKQVWRPHVWNWGLSEGNVLYLRKYLWDCWDFLAPPQPFGARRIPPPSLRPCFHPLARPGKVDEGSKLRTRKASYVHVCAAHLQSEIKSDESQQNKIYAIQVSAKMFYILFKWSRYHRNCSAVYDTDKSRVEWNKTDASILLKFLCFAVVKSRTSN